MYDVNTRVVQKYPKKKTQNRNFQSNSCLEWYSMRQFKKIFLSLKSNAYSYCSCVFFLYYSYILLVFFLFCYFLPDCLTACMHAVCGYG